MRLLEQSTFDELTLEMEGIKLTLRRGGAVERSAERNSHVTSSAIASTPTTPVAPAAATPALHASPPAVTDPNVHPVSSPLLGTFYRAPKPGAPPFVEVGAVVEEETVVAIIEVMKLMNTVRAGVRGTVTEILARDGALVEYGETLVRIRKTKEPV
jgi:acetyl-CoA carboxylase biotin carboxyl carrier protein